MAKLVPQTITVKETLLLKIHQHGDNDVTWKPPIHMRQLQSRDLEKFWKLHCTILRPDECIHLFSNTKTYENLRPVICQDFSDKIFKYSEYAHSRFSCPSLKQVMNVWILVSPHRRKQLKALKTHACANVWHPCFFLSWQT